MRPSVERLRLLNLPVFYDIEELASLIHISPSRLEILVHKSSRFYKRYSIPKRNGGDRHIFQPSSELKAIQAWILRNILDKLSPSDEATAFIRGKSLVENVKPHQNNRYFVCIDLEDFFPSIDIDKVYNLFQIIGYHKLAALILTSLCSCSYILPQGAVTSPSLSNLVTASLDRRLSGFSSRRNIVYTRYADDMTFSSNNRNVLNKSVEFFLKIIKSEGFEPNNEKLRVMGPRIKCTITGLVKNSSSPSFGIGKKKKRKMRAIMHNAVTGRNVDPKYSSTESIEGWLNFLLSVDDLSYMQMKKYWDNLNKKYDGSCC